VLLAEQRERLGGGRRITEHITTSLELQYSLESLADGAVVIDEQDLCRDCSLRECGP
jgi:hypothetical protein